jgi:hypothetical protein
MYISPGGFLHYRRCEKSIQPIENKKHEVRKYKTDSDWSKSEENELECGNRKLRKLVGYYMVKNLRTLCFTQVTKSKDSYLYKNSSSAETRWCVGDWVTARELIVLGTDYV